MDMLTAQDVVQILGVKRARAYQIIRQLNDELTAKGYLIIRGKVPKKYLMERFYAA